MKKLSSIILICLLAAALLVSCVPNPAPSGEDKSEAEAGPRDEKPQDSESETEPQDSESETEPQDSESEAEPEPLDMKAFLTELAGANPDASAEELCDLMLENPYFRLFRKESTEYFYPALDYEFQPQGVKSAYSIWDSTSGTRAVIDVFEPEEGVDMEALAKSLEDAADPYWTETPLPNKLSFEASGKVFFAMYPDDMQPVTGPIAEKARDFVEIFHAYLSEHPAAAPLEITEYFLGHQKIGELYTVEVEPGRLTGFGDFENEVEITGFDAGALLNPMMSPNTNIFYVFHIADGDDAAAFEQQLKDHANLVWNVCMAADTVITEIDGQYVLFMMCSEGTGN